jgi:hypothetical protein
MRKGQVSIGCVTRYPKNVRMHHHHDNHSRNHQQQHHHRCYHQAQESHVQDVEGLAEAKRRYQEECRRLTDKMKGDKQKFKLVRVMMM